MYRLLLKKYYPFLIIIFLVISNIVTYCYYGNKKSVASVECPKSEMLTDNDSNSNIIVDIKGEVKKPGIYQIESGSNLNDLIKLAGGLTKNGTTNNVNLARKLTDQSVIVIKSKKQNNTKVVEIPCVCPDVEITNCDSSIIEVKAGEKLEGEKNKPVSNDNSDNKKISINKASKEELMTLSGIGEAKADAIIAYRNQNGLFTKLEDLINVSGISENVFNKIKDAIEL